MYSNSNTETSQKKASEPADAKKIPKRNSNLPSVVSPQMQTRSQLKRLSLSQNTEKVSAEGNSNEQTYNTRSSRRSSARNTPVKESNVQTKPRRRSSYKFDIANEAIPELVIRLRKLDAQEIDLQQPEKKSKQLDPVKEIISENDKKTSTHVSENEEHLSQSQREKPTKKGRSSLNGNEPPNTVAFEDEILSSQPTVKSMSEGELSRDNENELEVKSGECCAEPPVESSGNACQVISTLEIHGTSNERQVSDDNSIDDKPLIKRGSRSPTYVSQQLKFNVSGELTLNVSNQTACDQPCQKAPVSPPVTSNKRSSKPGNDNLDISHSNDHKRKSNTVSEGEENEDNLKKCVESVLKSSNVGENNISKSSQVTSPKLPCGPQKKSPRKDSSSIKRDENVEHTSTPLLKDTKQKGKLRLSISSSNENPSKENSSTWLISDIQSKTKRETSTNLNTSDTDNSLMKCKKCKKSQKTSDDQMVEYTEKNKTDILMSEKAPSSDLTIGLQKDYSNGEDQNKSSDSQTNLNNVRKKVTDVGSTEKRVISDLHTQNRTCIQNRQVTSSYQDSDSDAESRKAIMESAQRRIEQNLSTSESDSRYLLKATHKPTFQMKTEGSSDSGSLQENVSQENSCKIVMESLKNAVESIQREKQKKKARRKERLEKLKQQKEEKLIRLKEKMASQEDASCSSSEESGYEESVSEAKRSKRRKPTKNKMLRTEKENVEGSSVGLPKKAYCSDVESEDSTGPVPVGGSLKRLPPEVLENLPEQIPMKIPKLMSASMPHEEKPKKKHKKDKSEMKDNRERADFKKPVNLDYIPLETSTATKFGVVPLEKAVRAPRSISQQTAEFCQNVLFGSHIRREPAKNLMMYQEKKKANDRFVRSKGYLKNT